MISSIGLENQHDSFFIDLNLHVCYECDVASQSHREKLVLILFKIEGFFWVSPRIVIENLLQGKF